MDEQLSLIHLDGLEANNLDQSHAAERHLFEGDPLLNTQFGGVYLQLRREGWYWRDAAYIAWKSLPKKVRRPKTQAALADMLGMEESSLRRRRAQNPLIDQRANKAILTNNLLSEMDGVVEALMESAKNANYKNHPDRKLALEMAGLYIPKQAIGVASLDSQIQDTADMDEEALRRLSQRNQGIILEGEADA